jgi:ATP-dependent Lon protease
MPDGNTTVILQGKKRFMLKDEVQSEPYIKATLDPFKEIKLKKIKSLKPWYRLLKTWP